MMRFFVVAALLCAVSARSSFGANRTRKFRDDPADTWLAYAESVGTGNRVTFVNATWNVPANPSNPNVPEAPGWWFGIEPRPAAYLIQPILAYGDPVNQACANGYCIFNGYYQWNTGYWWQSETIPVNAGDPIYTYVKYLPASNAYEMYIGNSATGQGVTSVRPVVDGQTYTDVYFVVEHQVASCAEMPSNGMWNINNIYIEINNQPYTNFNWNLQKYQDVCNCAPLNPGGAISKLQFTWSTS